MVRSVKKKISPVTTRLRKHFCPQWLGTAMLIVKRVLTGSLPFLNKESRWLLEERGERSIIVYLIRVFSFLSLPCSPPLFFFLLGSIKKRTEEKKNPQPHGVFWGLEFLFFFFFSDYLDAFCFFNFCGVFQIFFPFPLSLAFEIRTISRT